MNLKNIAPTKLLCALLSFTLFITACKKDFNGDGIEAASIGFVHASPGTGPLDFIVNGQKVNSFTYTKDLGYYTSYPGSALIGVAKKDTLKYLTTSPVNLASGKAYSAFIVDTLKKTSILLVEDDLKAPETDKAKVRFINLSPSSVPFNLTIQGSAAENTGPLFTPKAFKEFSAFTSINPSDNYTFLLSEASSNTIVATLPTVKIEKGKIYTIWAKGLKTATDSTKLDLTILSNN